MNRADHVAGWAVGALLSLIGLVIAWQLSGDMSAARIALALFMSAPLWLPLKGLARGNRRTYAWATLCLVPYFVLGVTEAIANPAQRVWAAACLGVALLAFVLLVVYLRVTR